MRYITLIILLCLYYETFSKTIIVQSKEDLTFHFEYGISENPREFNKSNSLYALSVPDSILVGTVTVTTNQNQQQYGFVVPLLLDTVSIIFSENSFSYLETDSLTEYLTLQIIDIQRNNDMDGIRKLVLNTLENYPNHPINLIMLEASLSLFDYDKRKKAFDLASKSKLLKSYQGRRIYQSYISSLKLKPGQEFSVDDLYIMREPKKFIDDTISYEIYAFSASWCTPCIKSIPILNDISENDRYKVVVINIDKKLKSPESYLNSYHESIGIYNLQPDLLLSNYGLTSIPYYILCKGGIILELSDNIDSLLIK
jgi:thiol-disulfide isomerase/thioredoxin